MRRILAITRKELRSYFSSPVAYIVAAVYLLLFGYFFCIIVSSSQEAHLRYVFHNMNIVLLLTSPMLTMRLFAEERKLGTYELLMTSPITIVELVTGKLLGAVAMFAAMTLVTLEYPLFLAAYASPDWGPILTGYLGFSLVAVSFMSVGMFASSLTDNQIVATITSFGILLFLVVIAWSANSVGGSFGDFLRGVSVLERFENASRGVLDSGDVFFYVSLTGIFTFLTVRALDWKRW